MSEQIEVIDIEHTLLLKVNNRIYKAPIDLDRTCLLDSPKFNIVTNAGASIMSILDGMPHSEAKKTLEISLDAISRKSIVKADS